MDEKRRGKRYSLFWPIVFIGVGVVALLVNMGVLSRTNIVVLFRLWPLILILIGVDIMFGRRAPAIGALIGVAAVALVIVLMLIGPSLGWSDDREVKSERFREALGEATSARVSLDLVSGPTTITALRDSDDLIDADLHYTGKIRFKVRGTREKSVSLSHHGGDWSFFWFDWFDVDDDLRWDIGLSPRLPLDLEVNGGSGRLDLDLSELQLTELNLDVGSGSVEADLPAVEEHYEAQVDGGSGSCTLRLADGADAGLKIDGGSGSFTIEIGDEAHVTLRLDGGSGGFSIDVPDGAAVRVDVRDHGSGHVRVPSRLEHTRRGDDDEGTWESEGFGTADNRVEIIIEDLGSGNVDVH